MKKETRTICYDEILKLEAYRLEGTVQNFPNHLHDYYVLGLIKEGERYLSCKNKEYNLRVGDVILFNPGDSHACAQSGGKPLYYLGINIKKDTMLSLTKEITGSAYLPHLSDTVVEDKELADLLHRVHDMIMDGSGEFEREETLLLMMELLIERHAKPFEAVADLSINEIDLACDFIKKNYPEPITLEQLCKHVGFSKSTLLRAFTKAKGMTPYRYLQSIRIEGAKKLLEQGYSLIEAASLTGFSDQSHFARFFAMFIGLTPGAYRDIFKPNNNHGGTDES